MCVSWIWGNNSAFRGAVTTEKISLPPLIPGGAAALLVSECEFALFGGFRDTLGFFLLFSSVGQYELRMDKAVPGFECSIRLSFQCDEVQVLVVRRNIHKAY